MRYTQHPAGTERRGAVEASEFDVRRQNDVLIALASANPPDIGTAVGDARLMDIPPSHHPDS